MKMCCFFNIYTKACANSSGSGLGWRGGGAAAEAVQTKCLLSTPVSSSVLLLFFFSSSPNTATLLFSSAERGQIRCRHLNIKVPGWKSTDKYRHTTHRLLTSVLLFFYKARGLSVDIWAIYFPGLSF